MRDDEFDELIDDGFAFHSWEPTGDTLYGDSIGAESTFGMFYDRLLVEKQNDGWHASLFVVAEPRDELGGVEYDLWPDDEDDLYTMVDEEVLPTIDAAKGWCEGRDAIKVVKDDAQTTD